MKMKWILLVLALLLSSGCNSHVAPSPEPEVQAQAPVVEPEQRTISFVGRLTGLERTVQYRSIPWVGTFVREDGKNERFMIGGNDHPLFGALGMTVTGGGPLEADATAQPVLRLEGRSCPIEGVWELTSWKKIKE
jgi:hypothetical protein